MQDAEFWLNLRSDIQVYPGVELTPKGVGLQKLVDDVKPYFVTIYTVERP